MTRILARLFRRFRRDERGTATLEFCLVLPAFLILFVSSFESGILMTRHVMLERGLDMAVRAIRLNTTHNFTHTEVKRMICNSAAILPNCMTTLKLEMTPTNPRAWVDVQRAADCVDVQSPNAPVREFQNGQQNQLMVLRACALFKPLFPRFGLGSNLPHKSGNMYALISTSAFVMEPR